MDKNLRIVLKETAKNQILNNVSEKDFRKKVNFMTIGDSLTLSIDKKDIRIQSNIGTLLSGK